MERDVLSYACFHTPLSQTVIGASGGVEELKDLFPRCATLPHQFHGFGGKVKIFKTARLLLREDDAHEVALFVNVAPFKV